MFPLIDFIDNYLPILIKIINSTIEQNEFLSLKMAEILAIFKKKVLNKESYRPVSLMSHIHIEGFWETFVLADWNILSRKLQSKSCGFRKNCNTQYVLIYILEKWKSMLDKGKYVGAAFMHLSKVFDAIDHDLFIAKLKA